MFVEKFKKQLMYSEQLVDADLNFNLLTVLNILIEQYSNAKKLYVKHRYIIYEYTVETKVLL